ncbi:branched-chain amino acid ABC transporter permease [Oceanibacterium hippocampi]|uniref:High-affinity branched-chain amino acid transport system permease protein LivH n=1 Tax=Oceanibacterium hippocampi TaxID=745714 RepID=A0A1Y5R6U7_9PROT|nr:branched-chain amino acid ABC transporter permease [Oceanibacterium hippocampi]SLN10526.1 High-affinity branched-chain amino acid transport system permease protein LivH [Oceanibacterium hippocampi]
MTWELAANVVTGGLLIGLVYALMALGLSVIFGVTRIVNFAHGEMTVLAMFAAVILFRQFGLDPILMSPIVAAGLFALGYGLQRYLVAPFVTRPEHEQFILLLAVAFALTNGMLIVFGPEAQGILTDYSFDSYEIGPLIVDKTKAIAGLISLVVAALLLGFFRYSATGRAIRACADNLIGAGVVGLNVPYLYALTFAIGAATVGVAGCLLSIIMDATPVLGPELTLLAFIIVIVGGLGSMTGALLGGVLIGVSEALAGLLFTPSLKSMLSFGLLILVLVVRPQGLFGKSGAR